MNRLGSGSDWLTRCCCFEKSLVEGSAQGKKKKRLIWGSAWFKVRKLYKFLLPWFTLEQTPSYGFSSRAWFSGFCPLPSPTPGPQPFQPSQPSQVCLHSLHQGAIYGGSPAQQRLPGSGAHGQGGVSTLRRERVDFCPVRSRPALHLGTSAPSPLASGAFPKYPEKSHPSLPRLFSLSPAFFLSALPATSLFSGSPSRLSARGGQDFRLFFSL